MIGDIRVQGMMVGIDIVYNQASEKPNPTMAEEIVFRLKNERVIVGLKGISKSVLLLLPPLCFTCKDVERFIAKLDRVLSQMINPADDSSPLLTFGTMPSVSITESIFNYSAMD